MNRQGNRKSLRLAVTATLMAVTSITTAHAAEWQAIAGAESKNRGSQALAFLPNEFWIHTGDSIRWTFPTHERHTISLLTPGEIRPAGFGPTFGVPIACPGPGGGVTPDGSSYTGASCVSSGVLLLPENAGPDAVPPTYTVVFPSSGNFKFVCLLHADMTGVVHVRNPSDTLPHDQAFYDRHAQVEQMLLLADASLLEGLGGRGESNGNEVAAGVGQIASTGAGAQTAALMRFLQSTIVVKVGDTVEWTSLDPSINHTVTFGVEPSDPRPPSGNVTPTSDGARQAVISSAADNVNSGFLSPAPQDRANLAQSSPGVTRFRVMFMSPGTFNYICAVHDQLGMEGKVIVHP
jgi:plastocyanin